MKTDTLPLNLAKYLDTNYNKIKHNYFTYDGKIYLIKYTTQRFFNSNYLQNIITKYNLSTIKLPQKYLYSNGDIKMVIVEYIDANKGTKYLTVEHIREFLFLIHVADYYITSSDDYIIIDNHLYILKTDEFVLFDGEKKLQLLEEYIKTGYPSLGKDFVKHCSNYLNYETEKYCKLVISYLDTLSRGIYNGILPYYNQPPMLTLYHINYYTIQKMHFLIDVLHQEIVPKFHEHALNNNDVNTNCIIF